MNTNSNTNPYTKLSSELFRRAVQSLKEVDTLLAKELSYSPELQKAEYVAELRERIERIEAGLA